MLGLSGALTRRDDLSASGERGVHASTLFVVLAAAGLAWALSVGDLTYRYVASWSSSLVPLPYRIGAVWAGPSGALLPWAFALGAGASVASATLRRGSVLRTWTSALLALLLLAVLAMATLDTNPFVRLPFPPDDGRGLPLEWMRPLALVQAPLGYVAMALLAIPSVMTVMGALGPLPWRTDTRRWALATWALLGAAMLLDWRRRYGDAAWAGDWRWAPVHEGTAFAWAGATLLLLATGPRWRAGAAVLAGFVAFTLGLAGITLHRALGWQGVHEFAASSTGQALGWVTLALVVLVAVLDVRSLPRAAGGFGARATRAAHGAVLVAAAAIVVAGYARSTDVALREGERIASPDRFGTPWMLSLEGVSTVGRENVVANVLAVRAAVKGRTRAFVTAEVRSLYAGGASAPIDQLRLSGIASGLAQDLRVDVRESNATDAILTVAFVPGVSWLWIAGTAAVIAALAAAFAMPSARRSEADDSPAAIPSDDAAPAGEGA